jgi:hypothetical protein
MRAARNGAPCRGAATVGRMDRYKRKGAGVCSQQVVRCRIGNVLVG